MFPIWLVLSLVMPCVAVSVAHGEPSRSHDSSPIISHIPRQPVDSTAIAKIGYGKRRRVLEIEFVNGAVYRYLDVPPAVYRDLMSAESKARFYDSNIRHHYQSVLVRSRQKEQAKN
jgi:KTSC domain-containing protein